MEQCRQILASQPAPHGDARVTDLQPLRFAVAAFDTWEDVQSVLRALRLGGTASENFTYLGLQRVLAAATRSVTVDGPILLRELPFRANAELISCTPGPMADRLAGRLTKGAQTLKAALGHWLIPRHAAHLQDFVEDGKIVLWVQLFDNDDERRAYQSLLAGSSSSVGVHDLIGA